jgi:hypothetical protein
LHHVARPDVAGYDEGTIANDLQKEIESAFNICVGECKGGFADRWCAGKAG